MPARWCTQAQLKEDGQEALTDGAAVAHFFNLNGGWLANTPAMHARMHARIACRVVWEGAAAPGVGDPLSELSDHKNRELATVACSGSSSSAAVDPFSHPNPDVAGNRGARGRQGGRA